MKKREKKSYVKKISIFLAVIMVSGLAVPTAYGVKAMEEVSIPENDVMELQENQTDAGVAAPVKKNEEQTGLTVGETDTKDESTEEPEGSQKPGNIEKPDTDESEDDQKPEDGQEKGYYLNGNRLVNKATGEIYKGTGFVPLDDEYYYVVNGIWDKGRHDVIKVANVNGANGKWWYVNNGKTDFDADTVAQNSNGWWYIEDGCVNFRYDGFGHNSNGWWYIENGKVDFECNSIVKGKVNGANGWWYVQGGQVKFTDTVAKNSNGWWYVENGKVDFECNSVKRNSNGWWKICNGKVDFKYNGFAENSNGWWKIRNGKVVFSAKDIVNGTVKGTYGWWYVEGGKVVFKTTVAENSNGWWCVENGKVNFNCNSIDENQNGWWKIRNGKVDFGFTGIAQNQNGWWYCKEGKVQFGTTAVIKGTVDGEKAWWYIDGGKVNKNYNGLGTNSNGTWLIENGKVNLSFNGTKTINGIKYTFVSGRCMSNYRGWKKIGGKYYYFDRNTGAQLRSCTVDGIRLNSDGSAVSSTYNNEKIRTMIKARSIMESITNTSDSKETKLRKCFNWVMKHPYKRYRTLKVARQNAGWEMLFANDHFERGNGCCVSDACAFAFLAHECGYSTVYICDDTGHAWTEINGRVYDPLFAEAKNFNNNYNAPYGVYKLHPVNKKKI